MLILRIFHYSALFFEDKALFLLLSFSLSTFGFFFSRHDDDDSPLMAAFSHFFFWHLGGGRVYMRWTGQGGGLDLGRISISLVNFTSLCFVSFFRYCVVL